MLNYHKYLIWAYGLLALVLYVLAFVTDPSMPDDYHLFDIHRDRVELTFILVFGAIIVILRYGFSIIRYSAEYASKYHSIVVPLIHAALLAVLFWYSLDRMVDASNYFVVTIHDAGLVKSYYYPKILFGIFCALIIWHCACYYRLKKDRNYGVDPVNSITKYS